MSICVGGENGGAEAIKVTSTLKNSEDGGAAEMLQAVLESTNTGGEASKKKDRVQSIDDASVGRSSNSSKTLGERRGW